jgi:7-carboxy-7-deazaguanine synthase
MHAVDPKQIKEHARYLTRKQIIEVAKSLNKHPDRKSWMTLSGGNPAIWDLSTLVLALKNEGMKVAIETQGSIYREWFDYLDLITVSPKGPSSGMHDRLDTDVLDKLYFKYAESAKTFTFKIVIFTQADLDFAELIKDRYPQAPFYLSVGTPVDLQRRAPSKLPKDVFIREDVIKRYQWLAESILNRPELWGSTISPQMHVLLYGHDKGK